MSDKRQIVPAAGLLVTISLAVYMAAQLNSQTPATTADLTNAVTAEVRDAQGQVLLRGQFVQVDEEDDDIERRAKLEPTGIVADASGEAEVEYAKAAPAKQEVEFSVRNLPPGVVLTFVIDGTEVATATADRRGRSEVELDVQFPGTPARR